MPSTPEIDGTLNASHGRAPAVGGAGPSESDALLRRTTSSSNSYGGGFAFHNVRNKEVQLPHRHHPGNAVDTLRVDLRKVALKLRIPLNVLLSHFQKDTSSESCRRTGSGRYEVTIGEVAQNPVESTPLCSPVSQPGAPVCRGTSVVIAHRGNETPHFVGECDASASASMCSDDMKVEVVGQKNDDVPYIAYLIQDTVRGATVMAIPNLPPESPQPQDEPFGSSCFGCCDFSREQYHESTSAIGEVSCMDLALGCTGKATVVKSIVLYSDNGGIFLQVQRWMPYWGIPCLATGIICSALIPSLYLKLAYTTLDDHTPPDDRPSPDDGSDTVGSAAAHVWWALGELIIATMLMLSALMVKGFGWLSPWRAAMRDKMFSSSNVIFYICVLSDVARHISWSFIINEEAPTMVLHSCHPLLLILYRLALKRRLHLSEAAGLLLAMAGIIIASISLGSYKDWDLMHGILAGFGSGVSTAVYLVSAHSVIANQPVIGVVWLCKVFGMIGALISLSLKSDSHSFWSAPFFGGGEGARYVLALACTGVARDLFYLCALIALHSLPVSSSMTTDSVLALLLSHALLSSDLSLGDLDYQYLLPGLTIALAGMSYSAYVGLRERQFTELDLTSPDMTRKTARPPPKLTVAALRHQQRLAKSDPPVVWEYTPPPPNKSGEASHDPFPKMHPES